MHHISRRIPAMLRWFGVIVLCSFGVSISPLVVAVPRLQHSQAHPLSTDMVHLLSENVVSQPILVGRFVVWVDTRNGPDAAAIYAFNLDTQEEHVIASVGSARPKVVGNDATIAWKFIGAKQIERYALQTQQRLVPVAIEQAGGVFLVALDDDHLYYLCRITNDGTESCSDPGLYTYHVTTGITQRVLDSGMVPIIADGTALWLDQVGVDFELSLQSLDAPSDPPYKLGEGGPCFHDVAGDYAAWCLSQTLYLTTIRSATTITIAERADVASLAYPVVGPDTVVWRRPRSTLRAYDITTGITGTIITTAPHAPHAFAITSEREVLFTVPMTATPGGGLKLYLTSLDMRNLNLLEQQEREPPTLDQQTAVTKSPRLPAGRVVIDGQQFRDDLGEWQVNGVHFFLPQYGINDDTFAAGNYASDSLLRAEWLNRAAALGAQTLRIFVSLPSQGNAASYRDIYNFAVQAEQVGSERGHGMRIALVLHNDETGFDLNAERILWINRLVSCFNGADPEPGAQPASCNVGNKLSTLTYVSVSNEINNYCDRGTIDCYDLAQQEGTDYIVRANRWTYAVSCLFKVVDPNIPITVGMALDVDDGGNGVTAVQNLFWKAGDFPTECPPQSNPDDYSVFETDNLPEGSSYPALIDHIDFLSIHHYGAILSFYHTVIRPAEGRDPNLGDAYEGLVLLEEHGYPTDPLGVDTGDDDTSLLAEGDDTCRQFPPFGSGLPGECAGIAPGIVLNQVDALRNPDFTFAGSMAFMLADTEEKNSRTAYPTCDNMPSDLYTGLFAADTDYRCDGTTTTGRGLLKNTGFIVCAYYHDATTPCEGFRAFELVRERVYLPFVRNR